MERIIVRFKDGPVSEVEVGSVEDAARLISQVSGHGGPRPARMPAITSDAAHAEAVPQPAAPPAVPIPAHLRPAAPRRPALLPNALRMVQALYHQPNGQIGQELAAHLGIDSRGLGPVILSLTAWGESVGLGKGEIIEKTRIRQRGRHVNVLKLAPPFRRVLETSQTLRDEMKIS